MTDGHIDRLLPVVDRGGIEVTVGLLVRRPGTRKGLTAAEYGVEVTAVTPERRMGLV